MIAWNALLSVAVNIVTLLYFGVLASKAVVRHLKARLGRGQRREVGSKF
ncbi:hypothetical protein [Glycomyces sp. NPDC047010]